MTSKRSTGNAAVIFDWGAINAGDSNSLEVTPLSLRKQDCTQWTKTGTAAATGIISFSTTSLHRGDRLHLVTTCCKVCVASALCSAVRKKLLTVSKKLLTVSKKLLTVSKKLLTVSKNLLTVSKKLLTGIHMIIAPASLPFPSPRLRIEMMFTSGVSRVFVFIHDSLCMAGPSRKQIPTTGVPYKYSSARSTMYYCVL